MILIMTIIIIPQSALQQIFTNLKIYKQRILTLREEHKLRVFENRVLRKTFGPKRDEVIGGWRKLHNEELHNLYCSPSIIRIIK
jgi:hypothetical protein